MLVRLLLTALGILCVVIALNDVFQSVIVPRAVGRRYRVTHLLWRGGWRFWPKLSFRLYNGNERGRENFLAIFAPLTLIVQFTAWSLLLLIGFGLVFWASSTHISPHLRTFFDALYFAGTSFFTIGFGDFVGHSGWTRMWSLGAGAAGLSVVGTTTAFLFAVFAAFQAREQYVVMIGARAGIRPNGVELLVIAGEARITSSLTSMMVRAQGWSALLMETHLAYPVLAYFRSSHDYHSWVGTLGTLLDASVLMMTTVQSDAGEARIFYDLGRLAAAELTHYFNFTEAGKDPGITRQQFDYACDRLARAGYALHDREIAWENFCKLRSAYSAHLNALAHYFSIPSLQWIGDRPSNELKPS